MVKGLDRYFTREVMQMGSKHTEEVIWEIRGMTNNHHERNANQNHSKVQLTPTGIALVLKKKWLAWLARKWRN